jgi:DNA polymerase-1
MKRLIVIDLSNFIFRAFFAIRPLHTPTGTPVNAVYGVLSMLHNMIVKYKPTHIMVARDTKEGSFRKEIYPEYKAHRSEPPDELIPQFAIVDELISVLRLPEMKLATFEADDIIGSVCTQWKNHFDEILIASGDKDLMQFVDGHVHMLDTMKDKIYAREDVKDKMGVYPEQIVDYLALIGDSSDNIPGVPGIGPKGAQGLLEEFGTLENVLKHVDQIKNKRTHTALSSHQQDAIISKKLAQIVTDLELKFTPKDAAYQMKLTSDLENFLNKVGFRSWLLKLADLKAEDAKPTPAIQEKHPAKNISTWSAENLSRHLVGEKSISIAHVCDDELNQFEFWRGVAIATSKECGYIKLDADNTRSVLESLQNSGAIIICFQSKPLLQLAFLSGIKPHFNYFDLSQAHFIINPEYRHDLATMTEEFLGQKISSAPKGQIDLFGEMNETELTSLGERAEAIYHLYSKLEHCMKEAQVERPYNDLDIPLIKVLAQMELEGISLNVHYYKELELEFSKQIAQIESDVFAVAGDKVNLRSPKQVGELLFEKLQLPVIRKTKTGYSTDADVLNELVAMDLSPIPEMLLRYREVEKLLSTYVKTLPLMLNSKTHKLHTHFQPSNAATGRLSSDHPNLQNIPVRTENGRKLRKGFIPSQGRVLLSADYSQVELRLLAHFSQDRNMLEAFRHDLDIHKQTASEVFDIPLKEVTKEQRNGAKAINFGLMYGQTSFGLSQALKISQGEAKKYITSYFQKFHSVKSYLDGLKELAEATGYAETMFGRKRMLPDIKSTNRQVKAMAERMAINSPIQGTAADIIKLAMINIQRSLDEGHYASKMILQVHDELIFDVVPEELEKMKVLVRDKMENAVSLSVPLKVEMGIGENWYDLK